MAIDLSKNCEEVLFLDLVQGMVQGIVSFEYVKKTTGDLRRARGTINNKFIPDYKYYEQVLYDVENTLDIYSHESDEPFHYYDVEASAVRSFIPDNLERVIMKRKEECDEFSNL